MISIDDRAFIICNGPSINQMNLSKMQNEITLGCNTIFSKYHEMGYAVNYYFFIDSIQPIFFLNEIQEYINKKEVKKAFILKRFKSYLFDINKINFISNFQPSNNVGAAMIHWAAKLGFKDIYIVGLDLDFQFPPRNKCNFITSESKFNYDSQINEFLNQYKNNIINKRFILDKEDNTHHDNSYQNVPIYWHSSEELIENVKNVKRHINSHFPDINIYNAGIGGKANFFERVDYEELF